MTKSAEQSVEGVRLPLRRADFDFTEHTALQTPDFEARIFRYPSGVEAVRIVNSRGYLVILPYLGQMIWDAVFDGVDLAMKNIFSQPHPVGEIVATYGCFAFHSGLLRNGCPGPEDNHALHGEMPCAPMDDATLVVDYNDGSACLRVEGTYEYAMGFGDHYRASPWVELPAGGTLFRMGISVKNLASVPMDLMYMCHVNFAWWDNARIIQPVPFTSEYTKVRSTIPNHVPATPAYEQFIEELMANPALMEILDEPRRYSPEQVFYIQNSGRDDAGFSQAMLQRSAGDALFLRYDTNQFSQLVRWVLRSEDQQVCAFALPSTCRPEGYLAEKKAGRVQQLAPAECREFEVQLGYLDAATAAVQVAETERLFDDEKALRSPLHHKERS